MPQCKKLQKLSCSNLLNQDATFSYQVERVIYVPLSEMGTDKP